MKNWNAFRECHSMSDARDIPLADGGGGQDNGWHKLAPIRGSGRVWRAPTQLLMGDTGRPVGGRTVFEARGTSRQRPLVFDLVDTIDYQAFVACFVGFEGCAILSEVGRFQLFVQGREITAACQLEVVGYAVIRLDVYRDPNRGYRR